MHTISLTEREQIILNLLSKGMNNREISATIHISIHTTKAHLESIYDKFGVHNRVQAAMKAVSLGLVQPE